MSTDQFLKQRSGWEVEYRPRLLVEVTGQQIMDALHDASRALNAGSAMAVKYGIMRRRLPGGAILSHKARLNL